MVKFSLNISPRTKLIWLAGWLAGPTCCILPFPPVPIPFSCYMLLLLFPLVAHPFSTCCISLLLFSLSTYLMLLSLFHLSSCSFTIATFWPPFNTWNFYNWLHIYIFDLPCFRPHCQGKKYYYITLKFWNNFPLKSI